MKRPAPPTRPRKAANTLARALTLALVAAPLASAAEPLQSPWWEDYAIRDRYLCRPEGSVVLERTLYARLYSAGELEQVLFTIGLIFISVAVARMIFGTLQQPVVLPDYLKGQFPLLGRDFPTYRVFIIAFSAVMIFVTLTGNSTLAATNSISSSTKTKRTPAV